MILPKLWQKLPTIKVVENHISKYNYHLTGQNSDFATIMAKITHYQSHSGLYGPPFVAITHVSALDMFHSFYVNKYTVKGWEAGHPRVKGPWARIH